MERVKREHRRLPPSTSSSTASSRWGPDTPYAHAHTSWINCALLGPAAFAHCFSSSLCHHAVAPPGPAFSSRPGILPAHSRCSINACPPEQNINRRPLGLRFCFVYCSFSVELFTPTVTIQERHSAVITGEQSFHFWFHIVLLPQWACGESKAKQNPVTYGPEPPGSTEKSRILFGGCVTSLMAVVPNTKSRETPQVQMGARFKGECSMAAFGDARSDEGHERESSQGTNAVDKSCPLRLEMALGFQGFGGWMHGQPQDLRGPTLTQSECFSIPSAQSCFESQALWEAVWWRY